jgi:hypothetical protein
VASADSFQIVAIPDTQINSLTPVWGQAFLDQTTWIRANASDISFVSHLGDLVQGEYGGLEAIPGATWEEQWARVDSIMGQLDAANTVDGQALPYSASIGNHDLLNRGNKLNPEDTIAGGGFRTYFGADRYAAYPWYGGSDATQWNHSQTFVAGGHTYLHINLEYRPELVTNDLGLSRVAGIDDAIAWAQGVIDANPGVPTILSSHQLLTDAETDANDLLGYVGDGADTTFGEGGYNGTGAYVWENLIRDNPQIFMTLNGHEHEGPYREDGEFHQVSTNDAGLPVFEILVNYQDYFNPLTGNDPYLRLIDFDLEAGEIRNRTFSPTFAAFAENPELIEVYLDALLDAFELGLPFPIFAGEDELINILAPYSLLPGDPVDDRAAAEAAVLQFFGVSDRAGLRGIDFSAFLTDADSDFTLEVAFDPTGRPIAIPEPSTIALVVLGLLLTVFVAPRRWGTGTTEQSRRL